MMQFSKPSGWQVLATKRKLLISCVLGVFFLAIGMDLRREPRSGHNQKMSKRDNTDTDDTDIWQPEAGVKWQIQLVDPVEDTTVDADIWDIDLFENTAETITTLKEKGHKVICYFSAGTYEDWRPDINKFDPEDFGSNLDEWPGERWLDITSDRVRAIMSSRLDIAKDKGCDGVDPDNIDAYGNENGLGLTEADSVDFLTFLAKESHSRGMAIGLKNGGDIIGSVIDMMQWSVNEQCAEYNECEVYAAFTEVNKPVFHIEYSGESLEARGYDDTSATTDTPTGSEVTAAGSIGPEGSNDTPGSLAAPIENIDLTPGVAGDTSGSLAAPLESIDPKAGTTGTTTEVPSGSGATTSDSIAPEASADTSGSQAGPLEYVDPKEGTTGTPNEAPTGSGGTAGDSIAPESSGDATGTPTDPKEGTITGGVDPKEGTTSTTSEASTGSDVDPKEGTLTGGVDPKEGTTGTTSEAPTGSDVDPKEGTLTGGVDPKEGTTGTTSEAPTGSNVDPKDGTVTGIGEVDPKEGTSGTTTVAPSDSAGTTADSITPQGGFDNASGSQAGPLEYVDPKDGATGTTTEAPTGSGATAADSVTPEGSGGSSGSLAGPLEYIDPKDGTAGTTSGSDDTLASLAAPIEYLDLKVSDDTSSPAIKTPIGNEATATDTVALASTDADTTKSGSINSPINTSTATTADINADVTKDEHLCVHGRYKVRARSVLSSKLKISACNAANTNKFSTVIKNMNLDAWVEYC